MMSSGSITPQNVSPIKGAKEWIKFFCSLNKTTSGGEIACDMKIKRSRKKKKVPKLIDSLDDKDKIYDEKYHLILCYVKNRERLSTISTSTQSTKSVTITTSTSEIQKRAPSMFTETDESDEELTSSSSSSSKQSYSPNSRPILILDMDYTFIDSTPNPLVPTGNKENVDAALYKGVHVCKLGNGMLRYVKFRPGIFKFLRDLSGKYDIYLYTQATRESAEKVVGLLREEGKLFKGLFTRDEIPKKKKKLKYILPKIEEIDPQGDVTQRKIVIVDDNWNGVWKLDKSIAAELVVIKPFKYFCHVKKPSLNKKTGKVEPTFVKGKGEWGPAKNDRELIIILERLLEQGKQLQDLNK